MKRPLFKLQSHLAPAFTHQLETGDSKRQLEVFGWADRLVAHEAKSGLWWGTLDALEGRHPQEFWRECMVNGRVGRLFSQERSLHLAHSHGATLSAKPQLLHMLVAHDNGGILRLNNDLVWHSFPPAKTWGIRRKLAHTPSVWSPRFQLKFVRRGFDSAYERAIVPRLPTPLDAVWELGLAVPAIRMVDAALALGWATSLGGQFTFTQFWRDVLRRRLQISPGLPPALGYLPLPDSLLQSPEYNFPGTSSVLNSISISRGDTLATFSLENHKVKLEMEIGKEASSAHEQLERSLELRDWLGQFFPADDVESWFER